MNTHRAAKSYGRTPEKISVGVGDKDLLNIWHADCGGAWKRWSSGDTERKRDFLDSLLLGASRFVCHERSLSE